MILYVGATSWRIIEGLETGPDWNISGPGIKQVETGVYRDCIVVSYKPPHSMNHNWWRHVIWRHTWC